MENSNYVSIARQVNLFNNFDVVANNIANTNTTAFKSKELVFKEFIDKDKNKDLSFAQDIKLNRNEAVGTMKKTDNTFDLAMSNPRNYFALETPGGIRYTRNGNFRINKDNILVNSDNFPVLTDDHDHISIKDYKEVVFTDSGDIVVDNQLVGRIGIFKLSKDNIIKQVGNSLVKYDENPELVTAEFQLVQGFLEDSNVVSVSEMAKMISISRHMEETTNLIRSVHRIYNTILDTLMQLKT